MAFSPPGMIANRQGGFTLVEVMVAMMIVALALPALLGQTESLSQHTFVARAKTQAFWVAQNKMAEVFIDRRLNNPMPPRKERDTVTLGRDKWDWTVTTEEVPVGDMRTAMFRVEVRVARAGEDGSMAGLAGFIHE